MATPTPPRLIKRSQLCEWLGVSDWWIDDRVDNDPNFPVIDIARPGSRQRSLRFDIDAVATYLGIQVPPRNTAETTAA